MRQISQGKDISNHLKLCLAATRHISGENLKQLIRDLKGYDSSFISQSITDRFVGLKMIFR